MAGPNIREWAAERGIELKAKGPVPKSVREKFWEENPDERPDETPELDQVVDDGDPGGLPAEQPSDQHGTPVERHDAGHGKPNGKRWFGNRKPRAPRAPRAPRVAKRRAGTEKLFSSGWSVLSQLAGGAGYVPLARVLELQAPVAGVVLDREVKGTAVDRVLQPLARISQKGEVLGALFGLPIMVQVVSMRPELYGALRPRMVDALVDYMLIAGPELKKIAERKRKVTEELGFDPEEMIDMIFAPPVGEDAHADAGD